MALPGVSGSHNLFIKNISLMRLVKLMVGILFIAPFQWINAQDKSNDTTARYFIIQASIGNLQEVNMGHTAIEQAQRADVKAFAQRMVADHNKAEAQLMQLIKTRGFQIPPAATDSPVEDMMLKNTDPKDFDRTYVHMMVPDHRSTVKLFEKYALTGKDPDVKAFAQQTLPTLKEHLAAIVSIDSSMNRPNK